MKRQTIPSPGLPGGPCLHDCDHPDCEKLRRAAQTRCEECGDSIGYNREYYLHDGALIHAECLDLFVEQMR